MNLRTGESAPVQAARMFIVPITLFSWASRGEAASRVDDQAGVDDGVDPGGADDPLDQRVLVGDLDELGPLELAGRVLRVDADDRLDLAEGLERLREPPAPVAGEAGDQDAPAGWRLASSAPLIRATPTFASPTISWRPSWIRARTSWATDWTSALSSAGSAPHLRRVDGLEEADLELGRQVAEHPQRAEPREGRA